MPNPTPAQMRVLCALSRVWIRDRRATVSSVAEEAGVNGSTCHKHLHALARFGLVRHDGPGTLRPGDVV